MAALGRNLPQPKSWEEELKEYLTNPRHYDVALSCGGRAIKASRHVLCARSKWFEAQMDVPLTNAGRREDPFQTSGANSTRDSTNTNSNSIPYASFGGLDGSMGTSPSLQKTDAASLLPVQESKMADTPTQYKQTIEVPNVSPEVLENIVQFVHTDDCRWFVEETTLTNLLELFIASKELEIESLYRTLMRKLSAMCVTKPTAIAVQEVARNLGATELAEHCRSYLLMCARELTDEELLKALVPKRQ
eukprot:Gregarina_sp_Poly_1__4036@NODE_2220_length_2468_cov_86_336943_g685_i1_p1_GENE_NODE_2220_length_2468_cov_86_336943_g685_i1NODE_2220_length_2468_cov_86_336943_g685_i1_p1_ORF_typecomplete_len247_score46_23BTB/PF00651_31/3_2e14BTB/PF00651_31/96Skp1_POZ/PF03931_15/0_39_NODE_2220_length_2468_cov_86_336943_g685_i13361076